MDTDKAQALYVKLKARQAAFVKAKAAADESEPDDEESVEAAAFPERDLKKNLGCGG